MIVGVPKEIKQDEYRVAMLPVGVEELTRAGHKVLVEALAKLKRSDLCCIIVGDDGRLYVVSLDQGKELWSYQTGSGIVGSPMSFSIDGKQYIAISAGNSLFVFGLRE